MLIEHFDAAIGLSKLNREISDITSADYLHVRHDYPDAQNLNMISISRRRVEFRTTLRILSGKGFHLYNLRNNMSSFVSHQKIHEIWTEVESGKILFNEKNIPYTWNDAEITKKPKLLVAFSSIATKPHQSSLRRHFEHNFATLQKYIPANTHVLRIADLGGVNGGWYANTNFLVDNFANVQRLIVNECSKRNIDLSDVVFFGVSKGATAALLHAMAMGTKAVAVDPIVSDHLYAEIYDDLHFTIGNFPKTKDHIFEELLAQPPQYKAGAISVVSSDMSPQFSYIKNKIIPWSKDYISFINVSHPNIRDHPDVGPNSLCTTVMLINMKLHGILIPPATLDVPFGSKT